MSKMHCADLGNGYYQNPVIFGGHGDSTILKDGDDYWMTFGIETEGTERSALMYHSKDLVNWETAYYMFKNLDMIMWAPELVKVGDTYYYYNFSPATDPHWNYGSVYVSWTKDIKKGDWTEPRLIRANIPSIDPGHVIGEDGKRYLFMSQNAMFPLTDDGLKSAGDYKLVYPTWPIPDEFDVEGTCTESPKLLRHDGWLYLTTAQGGTMGPSTSHMIISLRSKSVFGPWELSPYNPVKHTYSADETWARKGHGTLVEGPDGKSWYIVYGGFLKGHRGTTGKATLLEPIEWTEDGWWKIKEGCKDDEPIPMPVGGENVNNLEDLDLDFTNGEFPLLWNPSERFASERFDWNERGLTLSGKGSDLVESSPIFQKREHLNYEVICELTAEWHACAGICIGGAHGASGIALEQDRIKIVNPAARWMNVREHEIVNEHSSWEGNHIWFKLVCVDDIVKPWYSYDGDNWKKLNFCTDLSTSSIGGFHTAFYPGIFCYGSGQATFRSWKLNALD